MPGNEATLTHTAPSAPPASVRVSEVTSSSITVQWEPVDCIHRNGDITGYSVQYESGSTQTMSVSGGNVTEVMISSLMPSTIYSIQLAAETSAGVGNYSDPVIVSTNGKELACYTLATQCWSPLDILSVSFNSSTTTTLTLSWSLTDGLTATHYIISYSNTDCPNDTYDNITVISPSEMMYTLTGLEEGTEYSITVNVTLSDGETGEDSLKNTTMTAG